jgi:hypothetical protein
MLSALKEAKENIKDFQFHEGKRNFKVLDPNMDMRGVAEEEIWGLYIDPVHPLPLVYTSLAEAVSRLVASMKDSGERKQGRADSLGIGNRQRGEQARTRTSGASLRGVQPGRGEYRGRHISVQVEGGAHAAEATEAANSRSTKLQVAFL